MKMIYNGTPVNSLKVKHYEMDTNDCDMVASDLQAGKTAVAKGKKITGTGKSFEFAYYGLISSNDMMFIPNNINVVEIASLSYPVQHTIALGDMKTCDFSIEQIIGNIVVDGILYPVTVVASGNFFTISCGVDTYLEIFYGKDNYV